MTTRKQHLRKLAAGLIAAGTTLVLLPAAASADTACSLENPGGLLDITLTGENSHAAVNVNAVGEILVRQQGPIVACANGPATTANTNVVRVRDLSVGGSARVTINGAPLIGGDAEGDGVPEIELWLELGDGHNDAVTFSGTDAANNIRLGEDGVNLNVGAGGPDRETSVMSGFEELTVFGGAGDDVISAQGGEGTDGPFDAPAYLKLTGDGDNDQVAGGNSLVGDFLEGGPGNDSVSGGTGDDFMVPYDGDDVVSGGAGSDTVSFDIPITSGVTVDLERTTPQDTGQGVDTIAAERALGTSSADTLLGTAAANMLDGLNGNDTIDGRAGEDELYGGPGEDLVTYAAAPSGVNVDLAAMIATGGGGTDQVRGFDDLVGSEFADTLVGTAAANRITGLAGEDQVSAIGGADVVDVRDGEADIASCGSEIDTATADQRSLDSVSPDCENASFLPEPPGNGGDGGGAGGGDGELALELTAKRSQKVAKRGRATVTALCPAEACSVRATAKLKVAGQKLKLRPAAAELGAGEPAKLALRLKEGQIPVLRDALAAAQRAPKLKVIATATDGAGNTASEKLKVAVR